MYHIVQRFYNYILEICYIYKGLGTILSLINYCNFLSRCAFLKNKMPFLKEKVKIIYYLKLNLKQLAIFLNV